MKRLSFLPALGLVLGACAVSVTPVAPNISNLRAQGTFCTSQDTKIDFAFDSNGINFIETLEVAISSYDETNPNNIPAANRDTVAVAALTGSETIRGFYRADTDGKPGYTGAGAGARPQAIIVGPGQNALWVRAANNGAYSQWIKSNLIQADPNAATCDPQAPIA